MTARHIVFDIGNVLVRWHPAAAWAEELPADADLADFMTRTDFAARNLRADGGTPFADLAAEIADPDDRALLAAYPARFGRTVRDPITGSWDILDALRARGLGIHAITNWSAETWPAGLVAHPRLGSAFDTLVVSGHEGLIKPDPAIFRLFLTRAGLDATDCLFIDDSIANVAGARAVGMDAIHFTGPDALAAELADRGLL